MSDCVRLAAQGAEVALQLVTVCIFVAAVFASIIKVARKPDAQWNEETLNTVRLTAAAALSLGITFLVAVEILKTFRLPHFSQVGKVFAMIGVGVAVTWTLDNSASNIRGRTLK